MSGKGSGDIVLNGLIRRRQASASAASVLPTIEAVMSESSGSTGSRSFALAHNERKIVPGFGRWLGTRVAHTVAIGMNENHD